MRKKKALFVVVFKSTSLITTVYIWYQEVQGSRTVTSEKASAGPANVVASSSASASSTGGTAAGGGADADGETPYDNYDSYGNYESYYDETTPSLPPDAARRVTVSSSSAAGGSLDLGGGVDVQPGTGAGLERRVISTGAGSDGGAATATTTDKPAVSPGAGLLGLRRFWEMCLLVSGRVKHALVGTACRGVGGGARATSPVP